MLRYDHGLPRELREADIVFPPVGDEDDAASGAGIGFALQAVPQLRAEGWRVEIEGTWPFNLYEGSVAFSTSLKTRGSDWFSLSSPLKKASLTGFHATAKHIAAKAVSPSSETMRMI